jgi:glutamyl-tRNA reductase
MNSSQEDSFSTQELLQDNVGVTATTGLSQEMGDCDMEDIEGIVDQHLGDRRLSNEEEGTLVSKRSTKVKKSKRLRQYKDFISYVMSQLPPKRRRAVENKYEMLQNGEGKNNFLIFFFVSSAIIVY